MPLPSEGLLPSATLFPEPPTTGTTSREFVGDQTEDDGAYGTDIRKLTPGTDAPNSTNVTTIARFTNDPSGTVITFDPYTTRIVTGFDDGFGWVVNFQTADGMRSAADAKRFIPAGAWRFRGRWGNASAVNFRLRFRVYRIAAAPGRGRTLLFEHIGPDVLGTTAANFDYTTASQPEILLEADESIQVTPIVEARGATGLLDNDVSFATGGGALGESEWWITVPAPGVRTFYPRAMPGVAVSLNGTSFRTVLPPAKVAALAPAVALTRAFTGARAFSAPLSLASAAQKRIAPGPHVAVLDRLAAVQRLTIPLPKSAVLSLGAASQRRMAPTAKAAPLSLTAAMARRVTAARAFSASLPLVASFARRLTAFRMFTASLSLSAAMKRAIVAARAFTTALSLQAAVQRFVLLTPKTVALSLSTAAQRQLLAFRAFSGTLSLGTAFARRVTVVRAHATALALAASGRVDMAFEVLNRLEGGAPPMIVRKVLQIFDD